MVMSDLNRYRRAAHRRLRLCIWVIRPRRKSRRIAKMGLMVSAQPNYIRVLGDAYSRNGLGPGRAESISHLGSLERLDVPLGLHSDFNIAPVDPLLLERILPIRLRWKATR